MQILIADDDCLIAAIVREGLKPYGYAVTAVENGVQALASVRQRRPALILLDAEMPVLDGFGALRALKGDASLKHVPVIMLTARRNLRDVMLARELGASDYLAKPFDILDLLRRMRACLGRSVGAGPARSDRDEASLVFGEEDPDGAHWLE